MLLSDAISDFMRAGRADGLSPATLKWYSSILTGFAGEFQGRELPAITANDMRDYIISLRSKDTKYENAPQKPKQAGALSENTINSHITALHAFWAWSSREYDIKNPMANIKRPRRRDPMPKAIAARDYVEIFNATLDTDSGIRDRALLAFLADTGCRLGGLLSLTLEHLDVNNCKGIVIEKGGRARAVHFTQYTARLLHQWVTVRVSESDRVFTSFLTGEALTTSGVNQLLKRLKKRARVRGRVNPHSFRHNFAREYLRNGGDVITLARLLGHSDVQTTAAYYAVFTEDELKELHGRFTPMNQLKEII